MNRATEIRILILGTLLSCLSLSCTDTNAKVYDQVVNFWRTPDQIAAGVAPVYIGLRTFGPGFPFGVYELNEVSTDEIIIPNRITEWNQIEFERLWKHSWDASHSLVENSWQFIYSNISQVNSIIEVVNNLNPKPPDSVSILAELKTIRAFYYYLAMDLFGNVPIVENNHVPLSSLGNKKRVEVFDYVEKELKDNLAGLTPEVSTGTYGRATRWFAWAILAKMYLNAEVYTGNPRWADCVAACDSILLCNNYALEENFFDNFKVENESSREVLFAIPYDQAAGLNSFIIQWATLNDRSDSTFNIQSSCNNGFCSTQEYYNVFNPKDIRRKMFLTGQQYYGEQQYVDPDPDPSKRQYDRLGNLLIFDPVITTFIVQQPKTEGAGARCAKWEFNKEGWGNMSNDFAIFRLADIILMEGEAQFRLGNNAGALTTLNQKYPTVSIRSRAGMPDFTAADLNPDSLLNERARELSWEGWRRNDMIRLGHYTDARIPEKDPSPEFRKLFPIPEEELRKNSYLNQNPGY